jgi:hypothetical protein
VQGSFAKFDRRASFHRSARLTTSGTRFGDLDPSKFDMKDDMKPPRLKEDVKDRNSQAFSERELLIVVESPDRASQR